ncbi:MAG: hypothetical protein JRC68_06060 [Deltaproteobacteria bacterium]|nr:hypothetical protein [Deltaproteobacteria bacterium]
MIAKKKQFFGGLGLLIGFIIVLVVIFSPVFGGKNVLGALDALYNSISKGSAYYIEKVKTETDTFNGNSVNVTLKMGNEKHAGQTALLFKEGGAITSVSGPKLKIEGDLGKILANCLADAESMYHNDGDEVSGKYGYNERQALYNWWNALKEMDKALKNQKKFKEAKVVSLAMQKAVETSYNYYKIEPQKISDRLGVVIFSLLFYVVYTLWYGFAIMYLFEGWGLRLD